MEVKFYLFLVTKAHRHKRAAIKIHITKFICIILMITEFHCFKFFYRNDDLDNMIGESWNHICML